MGKNLNPRKVLKLYSKISEKLELKFIENDFDYFQCIEKVFSMSEIKLKEIFGITLSEETFTVGEVFQHRNKSLIPQYFGDNFKSWMWTPAQGKTLTVPSSMNSPKEYVLPKKMNDTAIQKANGSASVDEDTFWTILYCLIIKPELGKELLNYELRKDKVYIIHVRVGGRVIAFRVYWDDDGWYLDADSFDDGDWDEDVVFLYFATGS
jgi:hypothetical protein